MLAKNELNTEILKQI